MEGSIYLTFEDLEQQNRELARKYQSMGSEVRHEVARADEKRNVLIVACGTVARIARTSAEALCEKSL